MCSQNDLLRGETILCEHHTIWRSLWSIYYCRTQVLSLNNSESKMGVMVTRENFSPTRCSVLTIETESRAAMARISAQETMPGQAPSTLDLISSITLNPLTELAFGRAVFSPVNVDVSSSSIDPSQPCFQTSHKIHQNFKNCFSKN